MAFEVVDLPGGSTPEDKVRAILSQLFPFLSLQARRQSVPVKAVEVTEFVAPDDSTVETVVTQQVDMPPDAALDYWDRLGRAIEDWARSLPNDLKSILAERIAIEVRW